MNLPPYMVANRSNAKHWSRDDTRNALQEAQRKKALMPFDRLEKVMRQWRG